MKVDVQNVTVILGTQNVIQDFNLSVEAGISVAIVGQSGTGKTTLLRTIAGLIKPSVGKVLINSLPPESLYGTANLAFLFQEAYLWQHLTVQQNLELVFKIYGRDTDYKHIKSHLDSVGLWDARNNYPYQLSVGMKARTAIARAMCFPPQVLLMDEPFASLDPVRRADMNKIIKKTCKQIHATSIWVTHDVVEAILFADVVIAISPFKTFKIFDTTKLPRIDDSGCLPLSIRNLRDQIIDITSKENSMA